MPGEIWVDPANFNNRVTVMPSARANVPAGYIFSGGSDGATDRDLIKFTGGIISGGYPTYGILPGETVQQALLRGNGTQAAFGPSGHA